MLSSSSSSSTNSKYSNKKCHHHLDVQTSSSFSTNSKYSKKKCHHFLDVQIDAVAKSRDGKFRIVSNDEREQTLNQLLTVRHTGFVVLHHFSFFIRN